MNLCLGVSRPCIKTLRYAQQFGVEWLQCNASAVMDDGATGIVHQDELHKLQDIIERHKMTLGVLLLPQGPNSQYWNARFGRPERDREIEDVCKTIEICGQAGIPVVEWTWSIVDLGAHWRGGWARGGAITRRFDYYQTKEAHETDCTRTPPGWTMDADEMWQHLEYFLVRIVPVAEQAGVRLALHHHDPPTKWLRGEARILGDFEGMKKFVELVPSEVNGFCLCQGTVAEQAGADVLEIVRYFGERDKINHVHFRNVRGSVPLFDEAFIDDGDVDMVAAMQVYHEVGYRYGIMPDHTPVVVNDSGFYPRGMAYALGYIKALMQAVGAKSRGPELKAIREATTGAKGASDTAT